MEKKKKRKTLEFCDGTHGESSEYRVLYRQSGKKTTLMNTKTWSRDSILRGTTKSNYSTTSTRNYYVLIFNIRKFLISFK